MRRTEISGQIDCVMVQARCLGIGKLAEPSPQQNQFQSAIELVSAKDATFTTQAANVRTEMS